MMFHFYDPLPRSSVDMVGRLAWLPFGRNPFLYSSDGIRAPGTSLAKSAYLIRDEGDLDHIQKFFPLESSGPQVTKGSRCPRCHGRRRERPAGDRATASAAAKAPSLLVDLRRVPG